MATKTGVLCFLSCGKNWVVKTAGIYYGNILFLFLYLKKTWNIIYEVDLDIFK